MKQALIAVICFALCLGLFPARSFAATQVAGAARSSQKFRGLWVTTVANLDYPTKPTTDSGILREEADRILDDAQRMGFNAIILQVRPSGDALYPSALSPWSTYLTGPEAAAPSGGFDPLKYWVEAAHKRGMELHAWFNPYRISRAGVEPVAGHIALRNPSWTVRHTDGNLYFNPGLPEVRKHITDVVMEVVRSYDVDGIHFDDYFYPGKEFADADTFRKYGAGYASIAEWRVNNVDLLIKGLRDEIKAVKPHIQFGISPFGIWANLSSNTLGSNTGGHESYVSQFADTRKWVRYEWIDYIAPQLYWHIGFSVADYEVLARWWADVVSDTRVKLYIGMAAYRAGNADPDSPWYGVKEIQKQFDLNQTIPEISGSILFRYRHLIDVEGLGDLVTTIFRSRSHSLNVTPSLSVNRPQYDAVTSSSHYFIGGASDPNKPLRLNGELVTTRTKLGLFGMYVALKDGENRFEFEQDGVTVTRIITKAGETLAGPMEEIAIDRVYPQTDQAVGPVDTIDLWARAPIGAVVTATVAGKKYTLNPTIASIDDDRPFATTFHLSIPAPRPDGEPRVVNHGSVRYQMTYGGKNYETTSPGTLRTIMTGANYYAVVLHDDTDTYEDNSRQNGATTFLHRGMTDRIIAEDGTLAQLASGLWIRRDRIKSVEKSMGYNTIRRIDHREDPNNHYFRVTMNYPAVAYALYEDGTITVTVNASTNSAKFSPQRFLLGFESLTANDNTTLRFKVPEIGGYYIRSEDRGFELVVRKKKIATSNFAPLQGITIMIDPGHGGEDTGAISLLGSQLPEKRLVLHDSLRLRDKLEALGATVLMTRMDDTDVSLYERLAYSRRMLPDLFLSLHADSMVDTSDLNRIRGFSIYYYDPIAYDFARQLKDRVVTALDRVDRGVHNANFYVVRGTWAPSVLLEAGFVSNSSDLEAMVDPAFSETYLDQIVLQVVSYFKEKPTAQ